MQDRTLLVRRIKIQPRYIKQGRYGYIRPELRLCGKWLEEHGFCNGKIATIKCEKNQLIIHIDP